MAEESSPKKRMIVVERGGGKYKQIIDVTTNARCGKVTYETMAKARKAARRCRYTKAAYECPRCGLFHVSSQRPRK